MWSFHLIYHSLAPVSWLKSPLCVGRECVCECAHTLAWEMSRRTAQQDLFDSAQQRPTARLYINWYFWAVNLGEYIQGPTFPPLSNSNRSWTSILSRLFHYFLPLLLLSLWPFFFSFFCSVPFCFSQLPYSSASSIYHQHVAAPSCFTHSVLSSAHHHRVKRDSRSQSLLRPYSRPATSASKLEFSFCFFQHDWFPQVTERIKLLITSKHKTSGSLAAKWADIYIFLYSHKLKARTQTRQAETTGTTEDAEAASTVANHSADENILISFLQLLYDHKMTG